MLDIDMEFRKGILFVRLSGELSSHSFSKLDNELQNLVDDNKVKFITFNVNNLNFIDIVGINTILKYNKALTKINGQAIICGLNNEIVKLRVQKSKILQFIFETKDELGAINYINLGGYL